MSFALERVKAKTQQKTWNCFRLHILDGLASADVSDALGITVNSVNVNCSRVLGRVRERCREYLEDLRAQVTLCVRDGKSREETKRIVNLDKYKTWTGYNEMRGLNVEGMYRIVNDGR